MDSNVRTVFLDRSKAGEKLQVLVVGSQSMDSGEPGYAELFLNDLADAIPTLSKQTACRSTVHLPLFYKKRWI
ncbi:hypothetical protein [Planococcus koreensis]|uniref:hypothetical protein n=1 Tax=Planococcus koreensis TaxID=112331 RepID=UPI0013054327|nr:hypothetical protein [Planococcus koreensis]